MYGASDNYVRIREVETSLVSNYKLRRYPYNTYHTYDRANHGGVDMPGLDQVKCRCNYENG